MKKKIINLKFKNVIKLIFLISIILAIIILIANYKSGNEFITGTYNRGKATDENANTTISCVVYDNQDSNNIKALLTVENSGGIDYIVKPDGAKILANGKQKIVADYNTNIDSNNTFEIKPTNGSKIDKTISITQAYINNQFRIDEDYKISYDRQNSSDKTYYKFGDETLWKKCYNNFLKIENLDQYTTKTEVEYTQTTLDLRKIDQAGNIVIANSVQNCISEKSKLAFDVFNYARYKGDGLGNYFTIGPKSHDNQYYSFTYNNINYGHGSQSADIWAIYELNCNKLTIREAEKLYVEFELISDRGLNNGYMSANVKVQYTDGSESQTIGTGNYRGGWKSFPIQISLNQLKDINKVIFTFNGRDPDDGGCQGRIKNVKLISSYSEIKE